MLPILWLARNKLNTGPPAGPDQYSLSVEQPTAQWLGDSVVWEVTEPEAQHWINAELWTQAEGFRLPPGGAPVKGRLKVVFEPIRD